MDDIQSKLGDILIYQNEKGDTKVDVYFEDDSIWLSQKSLASLYNVNVRTINEHINNIFSDGELEENPTIRNFRIVQKEGDREITRGINHYNFEMILAIGYRVRNNVGIHFRNWATNILKEYVQKGFAMNDDRLKNPSEFGADYFDELLERIRDIRTSEKRFYSKIKEIYTTSIDYEKTSMNAKKFFANVQNKMHFATHGYTSAELITKRVDAEKKDLGLTNYDGVKIRKKDIVVAKNYLSETEIKSLNRITTMYLDYAEDQAIRNIPMHMNDWEEKLNSFLVFNGREILENFGSVSAEFAKHKAYTEYDIYKGKVRLIDDDIKELEKFKKQ